MKLSYLVVVLSATLVHTQAYSDDLKAEEFR